MMELKVNNKAKTFSGTLGISEKRWDELTEACQIGSIKTKTTPEAIAFALKEAKIEKLEEAICVAYVVGAQHARSMNLLARLLGKG